MLYRIDFENCTNSTYGKATMVSVMVCIHYPSEINEVSNRFRKLISLMLNQIDFEIAQTVLNIKQILV